jgi:transposase
MKRKNRAHDAEFRRRAVELLISGRTLEDLGKEIGVSAATLWRWKEAYLREAGPSPEGRSAQDVYEENKELRRRLKQLENHHEILKKALGILSAPTLPPSMP